MLRIVSRNRHTYLLYENGEIYTADFTNASITRETQVDLSGYEHHEIHIDTDYNLWIYTKFAPKQSIHYYNTLTQAWERPLDQFGFDDTYIIEVIDDERGNIWIATDNKGIFIFQKEKEKLTHIYKHKNRKHSLPDNHISCFYKDNQDNMWIGTSKRGVAVVNLEKTNFHPLEICNQIDISTLAQDRQGNLWLGSDGEGLYKYDIHRQETQTYSDRKSVV